MRGNRWAKSIAAVAGLVMTVGMAGCGDDDDNGAVPTESRPAGTAATTVSSAAAPTPSTVAAVAAAATAPSAGAATATDPECPAGRAGGPTAGVTPERAEVRVAALPVEGFAPLFYAAGCGFFAAEGLDVSLEVVQSGPVAGQLLTAGEVAFSFNNWFSVAQLVSNGAPLTVVANGAHLPENTGAIFVRADSTIDDPADLVDATLATNATSNVGDITTAARLEELGIDGRPEWIETPLPDTIAAIQSGAVDGGMLPEPFMTAARAAGLREVLPLFTGVTADLPVAGYVSVAPFVNANPNTVAAFRAGIEQATAALDRDDRALRAYLPTFSPIPAEVAGAVTLSDLQSELRVADVQRTADLMFELGFLPQPVDMATHVHLPG